VSIPPNKGTESLENEGSNAQKWNMRH